MKYIKTGKSRYKIETPKGGDLLIFKDSYTGLWRAKQEGSPVDWAGPFMTLKETKDMIERAFS